MKRLGFPNQDEISGTGGKTDMDALVAYMRSSGPAVKRLPRLTQRPDGQEAHSNPLAAIAGDRQGQRSVCKTARLSWAEQGDRTEPVVTVLLPKGDILITTTSR